MMDTAVLDIDHENDFELMEVIANYLLREQMEFRIIRDNVMEITHHQNNVLG